MAARNFYFEEIEIPSFPEIIWFSQYPVENMDGQSYIHFAVIVQPQSYLILCDPMNCSTPGFSVLTISWSLLRFMSIELVMLSNHLIFCQPLLLLPSIFHSISSFPVSWLFTSGGQSIGASVSASVLPMAIQGWFPLGWTGWISLLSKGLSTVFSKTTVQKHQFFGAQLSLWSNSHICTWLLEKTQVWLYGTLSTKWCLCFLTCCLRLS